MSLTNRRLLSLLLWLPVVIYAVGVTRNFFHVANSAIFISTDDAVGNISYALATEGRYGFLSSPVLAGMPRHDGLFSYGPFYFYVGAALIWLFGYNLLVLRAIHLAAIIAMAAFAGTWFKRRGVEAVGALIAIGLLMAFERAHWPMVRPDSLVALAAVLFVIASGAAIRTGQIRFWFAAGLAASCGAFTHLVAWSLIPVAAVTVVAAWAADARDTDSRWRPLSIVRPLLALMAGGLGGAILFYASFGFRIADQLNFLLDYQRYTGSMTGLADPGGSYSALIQRHFEQAYWYLPYPLAYAVWLTLACAVAVVALGIIWAGMPARRTVLAVVIPPTVTWAIYFGSLGVYNNFHSGYAILNQVMWLWCAGALVAAAVVVVQSAWPSLGRVSAGALWLSAFAFGMAMITVLVPRTNYRALAAEQLTPIDQYIDRVLELLPARARAWGSVEFAIEHPGRVQLVQFWDGIKVLETVPVERRAGLFPDYLVWGSVENGMNTGVALRDQLAGAEPPKDLASWKLVEMFPQPRYGLLSIVAGPPYGTTRVYGWTEGIPALATPLVRIYDPLHRQWQAATGSPVPLQMLEAPPVTVRHGAAPPQSAVQSVRAELGAGQYLLKVQLRPALQAARAAVFAATATAEFHGDLTQPASGVDVSPWFADQDVVYLLHPHAGGAFYISQFGSGPPAMASVEAFPILPLPDYRDRRREPPPQQAIAAKEWSAAFPEITVSMQPDGQAAVAGNATLYGYQAYGPLIAVTPGQRMRIRVPMTVTAGRGCLGVLDGTRLRWLLAPDSLRDEYEFQINDSRTVTPVLADCSGSPANVVPMRATIGDGWYALWSDRDELYVDQLMREFRSAPPQ
jgi:hypothetical protein